MVRNANARLEFKHDDIEGTSNLYVSKALWNYLVTTINKNKLTVTLRVENERT